MLRLALLLAKNIAGATLSAALQVDAESDSGARSLAQQVADRLPNVDDAPLSLLGRALFRVKMRGGGLSGLSFLLRLSLAPTEEDWLAGPEREKQTALSALERPLRLARKYGKRQS
jgi:hypothetical protein